MNETLERIGELGISSVVKIEKAKDALQLGKALIDGDLPIAEITRLTKETVSTTTSIFADPDFEIMKKQYLGKHGHIAITTNHICRTINYLKMKGISVLPKTAKEKEGKLKAVYLDQEVSGFAIHLLQK